jgi:ParB-like chromosome segregation protein Spo0J
MSMSDEGQIELPIKADVAALVGRCKAMFSELEALPMHDKVEAINLLRLALHELSPFKSEPVDCVQWIPADKVTANDYNPNSVAPPEMRLLEHSITEDGYTQPIVSWLREDAVREVVDGFHRHRVGKESAVVSARVHGFLPVVTINDDRLDKTDRIASTIRHNRARGKHKVEAMSDIVIELKRRNWSDEKIGRELGMDQDEVLRLCQITGLAEAFADQVFSQAWEVGTASGAGGEILSDVIDDFEPSDGERILHTWDKWECFKAGFYSERPPKGMSQEDGEQAYRDFLSDLSRFEASLDAVTSQWKHSCEHYLTNDRMNRVAWLGQASVAHALGIPSGCRAGYQLLTQDQKYAADQLALKHLNRWLVANGKRQLMLADAVGRTEAELY